MTSIRLNQIESEEALAAACGVSLAFLKQYAASGQQATTYYHAQQIPKKGRNRRGEYRVVFKAGSEQLGAYHRCVSMIVANSAAFDNHVQGFVKGRSTKSNAAQHLAAKVLLHADIQAFFDAITCEHIYRALLTVGTKSNVANLISKTATIDGLLRQGTRCSPMLSNLVCKRLDEEFLSLASSHNCIYTRYADNITISGKTVPEKEAVAAIINGNGFELRKDSCFTQGQGRNQFVTGLSISDVQQPRLPLKLKRRMRLVMHYIDLYGLEEHQKRVARVRTPVQPDPYWLYGMVYYAKSIEPTLGQSWLDILNRAMTSYSKDFSEEPDFDSSFL